MLELTIPGRGALHLNHLVLDYNGTIALDGAVVSGVPERVRALAQHVDVHVITADTFGSAAAQLLEFPVTLQIIPQGDQTEAKERLVRSLGPEQTVAVGNGANDQQMLKLAALGICVLGSEGVAVPTLMGSDVVVPSSCDALDLLLRPGRLAATLRV